MRQRAHGSFARRRAAGALRHDGRELRETEIQNFRLAALDEKNIRGLDVAMDDAFGVRGVEAIRDLNAGVQQLGDLDGLAVDAMFERLAFEQFHGDERAAVEIADIVDGADVGMIQRGRGARFAAKTLDGLRVLERCRPAEISARRCGPGACPWLCRRRPSRRRPIFQSRCNGKHCHRRWERCRHRPCILRQPIQARNPPSRTGTLACPGFFHWRRILAAARWSADKRGQARVPVLLTPRSVVVSDV